MTERKAKRKLSDINFEGDGAHIALVSKEQGHGANGHHYALVMKAANFSEEFLEKASKVKVELSIEEYLTRFYGLWYEDAEILARALGFTTQRMEDEAEDAKEDEDEWSYEGYLKEKVASIEIMKSLYEAESIPDTLSKIQENDYLQFLQDQAMLEKAFKKIDKEASKAKTTKVVTKNSSANAEDKTSTNVDVEKSGGGETSVVKNKNKESKVMTEKTQVIEQEVEVIAKSQYDEILKSHKETQEQLQKALDIVKQFEQEKKELIAKSRKEQLEKACGQHAEVLFKACGETSDEVFADVVKALTSMQDIVEKSAMFEEKGASVDGEVNSDSGLAALIKAKYTPKQ